MQFKGTAGNDNFAGTTGDDTFNLAAGGNDTASGDLGTDKFTLGARLNAADRLDGGDGLDTVYLNGNYSSGLVFDADTIKNIEQLQLHAGFNYNLTLNDGNVAAGFGLIVDAHALGALDHLTFDGSAESDGSFTLIDGAGDDDLTGGQLGDLLIVRHGGSDTANGGGGDDVFKVDGMLDAGDRFNGGGGRDLIYLTGDYSAGLTLGANTITNVEKLVLNGAFDYDLTLADGNLAAGHRLAIDGSRIDAAHHLTFDGALESDGKFTVYSSAGDDDLTAGGGGDLFIMGAALTAADKIDGGGGSDTLELDGDYALGNAIIFGANTMRNVETLLLGDSHTYDLTTDDATVANGATLTVQWSGKMSVTFDGSNETDGHFHIVDGTNVGFAHLFGGSQSDTFDLTNADAFADTQARGGGGDDTFSFLANFDSSSQIVDGGTGTNTISLDGDYTAISLLDGGIIDFIQNVTFGGNHSYTGVQVFGDITDGSGTLTLDASGSSLFEADLTNGTSSGYAITGGSGDDTIVFGANYLAAFQVDGGTGSDTLEIDGTGTSDILFTATSLVGIETLLLGAGASYDYGTVDANVASGQTLTVDASALDSSHALGFGGGAENDGSFVLIGGAGADFLTGGHQADTFDLTHGGNDTASGNQGNDTFNLGAAFTASDAIDGGTNSDTVNLDGDYSGGLTFTATTMKNVESLVLAAGHDYDFTTNDATVASGGTLTVNASALGSGDQLTFDGTAETNGFFTITGGDGDDSVTLGDSYSGTDQFEGGDGNDTLVIRTVTDNGIVATFTNTTLQNVETIMLDPLAPNVNFYELDLVNGNVAAGATLTIDASALGATAAIDIVSFDGSAELDGSFIFEGGAGQYTIKGGHQNDLIQFGGGFDDGNIVDGGTGSDTLELDGDYGVGHGLTLGSVTNIETLQLDAGHDYFIATPNSTVASGKTLTVDGSVLGASDLMSFNATLDTDSFFIVTAGAANDGILGGALADSITGGAGSDDLTGNGGADTFNYGVASDSTTSSLDWVRDFAAGTDKFHLGFTVDFQSEFSSNQGAGNLDTDIHNAVLSFGVPPAHFGFVVKFVGADFTNRSFLVVDADGNAAYDVGSDLVVEITGHTGTVTAGDFV